MKFKVKVPNNPNERVASDASVDCIGTKVKWGKEEVATIINYEIVNGELILEMETDNEDMMDALLTGTVEWKPAT